MVNYLSKRVLYGRIQILANFSLLNENLFARNYTIKRRIKKILLSCYYTSFFLRENQSFQGVLSSKWRRLELGLGRIWTEKRWNRSCLEQWRRLLQKPPFRNVNEKNENISSERLDLILVGKHKAMIKRKILIWFQLSSPYGAKIVYCKGGESQSRGEKGFFLLLQN